MFSYLFLSFALLTVSSAAVVDNDSDIRMSDPERMVESYEESVNKARASSSLNRTYPLSVGVKAPEETMDDVMLSDSDVQTPIKCRLSPKDDTLSARLKKISDDGETHLIEYKIKFAEYNSKDPNGPLKITNKTFNYRPDQWYRVFTKHGRLLTDLSFGYAPMSFNMLKIGVLKINVAVIDGPPKCFETLNESEQVRAIRTILVNDLNEEGDLRGARKDELAAARWMDDDNRLCYEVIKENDGTGTFALECCKHTSSSDKLECKKSEKSDVIVCINIVLTILKISFFFFGPLVLQKLVFDDESTTRKSYVVPLNCELRKTILVKKVRVDDDGEAMRSNDEESLGRRGEMRQFTKFRKLVKTITSEEISDIHFNRLDIVVDHSDMMSENCVPAGLLPLVYDLVARCGVMRAEPFRSCCRESIFGSWSSYFLWLKLKKRSSDCNLSCRDWCAWATIFRCVGCISFMLLLPLPYYARLGFFYAFEKDEMKEKVQYLDVHDLTYPINRNLYQWLAPNHVGLVIIYIVYLVSYLLLAALHFCDEKKIERIVHECVSDMRRIRYMECVRLIFSHLLLPFEKFGVFGVVVGAVYFPIVMPMCVLISLVYCLPTLYITFRLIFFTRPECLKTRPYPSEVDSSPTLSNGMTSFERCFLLDSINPENHSFATSTSPEKRKPNRLIKRKFRISTKNLGASCSNLLAGLLLILCLLSLLLLYAESFGFFIEVCVLSLLGAILNASRVIIYLTLALWCALYLILIHRHTCLPYWHLSHEIFKFIKDRRVQIIESAYWFPSYKNLKNRAFKFFTHEELERIQQQMTSVTRGKRTINPFSTKSVKSSERITPRKPGSSAAMSQSAGKAGEMDIQDNIEYLDNRLHWNLTSLIVFIDKHDVTRIPRDIFWQICNLDVPGCPGPVYKAWLKALGLLVGAMVHQLLLFCFVWSFGTSYKASTLTQTLVVLAGGSLPLLVFLISKGQRPTPQLTPLSFLDKVRQVFFDYRKAWPVHDLSFFRLPRSEDGPSVHPETRRQDASSTKVRGRDAVDNGTDNLRDGSVFDSNGCSSVTRPNAVIDSPQLVDLLITIRDDSTDDNRRGSVHSDSVGLDFSNSLNAGAHRLAGAHRYETPSYSDLPKTHQISSGIGNTTSGGFVNLQSNATQASGGGGRPGVTRTLFADDDNGSDRYALSKQSSASTLSKRNTAGSATNETISLNMIELNKCSGAGLVESEEQGTMIRKCAEKETEYPTLCVDQARFKRMGTDVKGESEL